MVCRAKSCFKNELLKYNDLQLASGIKSDSYARQINYFDDFILSENINEIKFTEEMCNRWIKPREFEGQFTKYIRINWSIGFLQYLKAQGYDVFIPKRPKYISSQFKAYIYSEREVEKYFSCIDSYFSVKDPFVALYLPVIFRILYCCGTRIGETLSMRVKDVDIDNGILYLNETKNQKKRAVPVSEDLKLLLQAYSSKCIYLKTENDFFFSHKDNKRISEQSIYHFHRKALEDSNIPYKGNGEGPRLHDWRHTFCVNSLSSFEKEGADLYNVLPILKQYVGHSSIRSTEQYLQLTFSHFDEIMEKTKEITDSITGDNNHEDK